MANHQNHCKRPHNPYDSMMWPLIMALWVTCLGSGSAFADEAPTKKDTVQSIKELLEEIAAEQAEDRDLDNEKMSDEEEDAENKEDENKETEEEDGQEEDSDQERGDQEDVEPSNLPEVEQGRFVLPMLQAISTSTHEIGNGSTPKGLATQTQRRMTALPESGTDRILGEDAMGWSWTVARWEAANTFSNPRYFEDRMLERHGHQRSCYLQPAISGARFFGSIAMLPYLMSISPPCECEYTLGYYRSGSCAPRLAQRPPRDRRAILTEAAAVTSGILIFP